MESLTAANVAALVRLFSTPIESGDANAYAPSTVSYLGLSWKRDAAGSFISMSPLSSDDRYHWVRYSIDGAFIDEGEGQLSSFDPLMAFIATVGVMLGGVALAGAASGGAAASAGTIAGDAYLPGALGAGGANVATVLPGLESYVVGTAATTGVTAAATTTATASTAATVSGLATTAGKVLGVITTALGLTQAGGSTAARLSPSAAGQYVPINPPSTLIAGVDDTVLIVAGLAAILLFSKG